MRITIGTDSFDIYPLQLGIPVRRAAIYTIWTYDPNIQKYPFLYVGETGDLAERLDQNHHKYQCWLNHQVQGLFIGIWLLPTDKFTPAQRKSEELRLISAHNPICNG